MDREVWVSRGCGRDLALNVLGSLLCGMEEVVLHRWSDEGKKGVCASVGIGRRGRLARGADCIRGEEGEALDPLLSLLLPLADPRLEMDSVTENMMLQQSRASHERPHSLTISNRSLDKEDKEDKWGQLVGKLQEAGRRLGHGIPPSRDLGSTPAETRRWEA